MKKYFIYLAAVVLAVGLICVPTGIAKIVNGIAIKVDGEIITIHELEESYRMAVNRAQLLGNETPSKKEVAARLVEKTLIQQEAERRNIFVTESELDSVIENIKEQNNLTDEQFLAELKKESLTISELKETYRIDILKTRLIGQMASSEGQSISEQEIREFYKNPANKELFIVPGTIKLSEIYIPVPSDASYQQVREIKDKAMKVYRQASGDEQSFETLVQKYSQAPSKKSGGHLGSFTRKQLETFMPADKIQQLFSLEAGEVSRPIMLGDGYHIFKIMDKKENRQLSFEEAYANVKNYLMKQKGEKMFNAWLKQVKEEAHIQYMVEME